MKRYLYATFIVGTLSCGYINAGGNQSRTWNEPLPENIKEKPLKVDEDSFVVVSAGKLNTVSQQLEKNSRHAAQKADESNATVSTDDKSSYADDYYAEKKHRAHCYALKKASLSRRGEKERIAKTLMRRNHAGKKSK